MQEFARIGRKLELKQLLPHLFLRPAQKDDIAGGAARASENAAPKVEELVDGSEDRAARPDIIAEINDLVAFAKALADQIMQADETLRLGMDRGDGPYPLGSSQASKRLRPPRPVHAATPFASGCRDSV